MGLKKQALHSVKWSVISNIWIMVIQFATLMILARYLTPEIFGIYAMVFTALVISRGLVDSGLTQALIRMKSPTRLEYSAVFYFNLCVASVLISGIYIFGDVVHNFIEFKGIENILYYLTISIFLESLAMVQRAHLTNKIQFKNIAKVDFISKVGSCFVSIGMAVNGYEIWSLLLKDLTFSAISFILLWSVNPVRINRSITFKGLRPMYSFGWKIYLADQIESFSNQFMRIYIGSSHTASQLGYYLKAEDLQQTFSCAMIVSINKVVYPVLSKITEDISLLKKSYATLMVVSTAFVFPLMFFLFLNSKEIILLFLGSQWSNAEIFLELLCFSGMIYPFTVYNLNILKVLGLPDLYLKICLVSKSLIIPAILIGSFYSLEVLVVLLVVQQIFSAIINSYYAGRLVEYKILQQVIDVGPNFLVSIITFMILFLFKDMIAIFEKNIVNVLLMSVFYGLIYLVLSWFLNKNLVQEIKKIIQ